MSICQGLLSTVASFGTQTDGTDPLLIPFGSLTQSRKVFRSLPTLICFKHNVLVPTDYIYGFDLEFSLIPLHKLLKCSAMEVSQARNWMSTKSCLQSCWASFQQHSRHKNLLANLFVGGLFVDCEASCVCRRQHS
jgi:hypothetical protein